MPAAPTQASQRYLALYRSTVQEAAASGGLLMGKLVAAARTILQAREAACRDLRERDALAQSAKQLRSWEAELCKRYPQALFDAFSNPEGAKKAGTLAGGKVEFDELELMDEVQVLTSVTLARAQQVAMLAAEASLAELNTLICSALGLGFVNAERNPLRPQIYVNALKAVVEQTQVPPATQLDWLAAMSNTLGQELRNMYVALCAALRGQGVVGAGYTVLQSPGASASGVGRGVAQDLPQGQTHLAVPPPPAADQSRPVERSAAPANPVRNTASSPAVRVPDDTLLTLDKLRRLLAGELDAQEPMTPMESFAQRFAREFEEGPAVVDVPAAEFDATVPAALEALKEMKQVDEVVQRLQSRRGANPPPVRSGDTTVEAIRAQLRSESRGVAQSLSLEVVTLMVDNIAQDARLLPPIQQLIRRLEPPLLRLALVDPRFFTNKRHPARVLVQEVADRSLAYASPASPGFVEFAAAIEEAFAMLNQAPIENAEPFERVLNVLRDEWRRVAKASERSHDQAVQALRHAEERNVLAEKITREILGHADTARVPAVIVDFLCGPWAQVVAQARIGGSTAVATADKYQALISALLWSTHPDLTRKDTAKLTRLVPPLLSTLREGLDTIHYPSTKTSAFFEALMGLHQRAFRAEQKPLETPQSLPTTAVEPRVNLVEDGNPWIAPEEARASNFMDLPDLPAGAGDEAPVSQGSQTGATGAMAPERDTQAELATLELGCWVELMANDQWVRTQLTWASPHGTLFLFTSAAGAPQSMTRRSRDKLVAAGHLRVISGQPVVDGALNVVAQLAMHNSVNTMI